MQVQSPFKWMVKKSQGTAPATAIEYGLIAALISITIIAAASSIGGGIKDRFEAVQTDITKSD